MPELGVWVSLKSNLGQGTDFFPTEGLGSGMLFSKRSSLKMRTLPTAGVCGLTSPASQRVLPGGRFRCSLMQWHCSSNVTSPGSRVILGAGLCSLTVQLPVSHRTSRQRNRAFLPSTAGAREKMPFSLLTRYSKQREFETSQHSTLFTTKHRHNIFTDFMAYMLH